MKKLSLRQQRFCLWHSRERARCLARRRYVLQARRLGNPITSEAGVSTRSYKGNARRGLELILPEKLSLTDDHDNAVRLMNFIRATAADKRARYFNFENLRHIDDAAALLLAAQIEYGERTRTTARPRRPRRKDRKWDPEVETLLQDMGFFDLLRVRNPPRKGKSGRRFVKFQTHNEAVGMEITRLRDALEHLVGGPQEGLRPRPEGANPFYDALMEAMTNVSNHAYSPADEATLRGVYRRWWMGGSFDADKQKFIAVFYDAGMGIPTALPVQGLKERLLRQFQRLGIAYSDASIIKAAMVYGRSRTKKPHRGKGLPQMRQLIRERRRGKIIILSGRGEYRYELSDGRKVEEVLINHAEELRGTLIQWELFV